MADITKPLGSVKKMLKAGNRVVFESSGSYVQNISTGRKTPIHERHGTFAMDLWIQDRETSSSQELAVVNQSGSASTDPMTTFLRHV